MEHVINPVFRQENEIRDVVLDKPVVLVPGEVRDVLEVTGNQVVDRDNPMTLSQQPISQMGSEKTCATGDYRYGLVGLRLCHARRLFNGDECTLPARKRADGGVMECWSAGTAAAR